MPWWAGTAAVAVVRVEAVALVVGVAVTLAAAAAGIASKPGEYEHYRSSLHALTADPAVD